MAMNKYLVWAIYAAIIIILGVVGYFVGRSSENGLMYAGIGAIVGAVISVILYFVWGKTAIACDKAYYY